MLKVCVVISIAITTTNVNAQNITYNLAGRVGQYSAPAKAYLMYFNGPDRHIDSIIINKGIFVFKGISDRPKVATLFISTKGLGFMSYDIGFMNLYLEAGDIAVISPDSLKNAKISGGSLNKDFDLLKLALKEVDTKLENKGSKNEAMILYGINNLPQNFLVSPDGKIINKNLRGDDLVEKLKKLFDQ